ncbi:WD40/YVTN/BNR-like repeat-containing protein [Dechloromonas sp. A34]|uniref:WD40/YVTN/BNR-like repeat-containing protein n=1 Tax=Dechloromonas sp. A34 TaxID=447588 RepID=UPI00224991FB|nr:YCF48-related protein [Dechloromonas sp. A34]
MKRQFISLCLAITTLALAASSAATAADKPTAVADGLRSAPRLIHPEKAPIFASALAGKRIVAVGDHGFVILSDDGKSFRQAAAVPTRAPLTSVHFIDNKRGWAAGHDGTILSTGDGGEHWQVLREERGKERVLLSVWFENATHGLAVGQFGLALETMDSGKTWQERRLIDGEAGEIHLLQIVPAGGGLLLVAGEAGAILRSEDNGATWRLIQTDNKGSFWTGLALRDGSLLMAGLRGHLYRSVDRGLSWKEIASGTQQSLTAIIQHPDGSVHVVGAGGVSLSGGSRQGMPPRFSPPSGQAAVWVSSEDEGQKFEASVRPDRAGLTSVAAGPAGDVLFSVLGVVSGH